jgi:hypothetical protein
MLQGQARSKDELVARAETASPSLKVVAECAARDLVCTPTPGLPQGQKAQIVVRRPG